MITFVCEEHTVAICHMPDDLFANLMTSLEKGVKEYPLKRCVYRNGIIPSWFFIYTIE